MTNRIAILILVAACSRRHEAPASQAKPTPLARATQADLARELDAADRHGTWAEVRQRWQGQALHWTVTRYRSLCSSADACHVAAFPIERPAKHGWMPQLDFAAGEYDKLERACGGAEPCRIEVEGTLRELSASAEQPTSLRFSEVRVVNATHG